MGYQLYLSAIILRIRHENPPLPYDPSDCLTGINVDDMNDCYIR